MTTAITFKYGQATVRARADEQVSLTDMWNASGADDSKRPADWRASTQARSLEEFLAENVIAGISGNCFSAEKGVNGGTWAHWHLALAYAKYLSPAFHVWCNDVIRREMEGAKSVTVAATSTTEIAAVCGAVVAAIIPQIQQVVRDEIDRHRQQAEQTIGSYRARRILAGLRAVCDLQEKKGSSAWRSKHRRFCNELRDNCQLPIAGPWDRLPLSRFADIELKLAAMVRREHGQSTAQGKLMLVEPASPKGAA